MPRVRGPSNPALPAVLLGGAVNALSVARALWRRGVAVDLLADGRSDSVTLYSRACRRYVRPSSDDVSGDWMRWLADKPSAALLPCSDEGVEFVARNRPALESMGHRPIEAEDNALLAMLDKRRAYELARRAGVPAPRPKAVTSVAELDDLDFTYPCAVKPIQSHLFARRFHPSAKGAMLTSAEHPPRVLAPVVKAGYGRLLTEVVAGPPSPLRPAYHDPHGAGGTFAHFLTR